MSKAIAEGGNDEVALAGVFERVRRTVRGQVEDAIHRPHGKVTVSMVQRPFARKNKDDLFLEQVAVLQRGALSGGDTLNPKPDRGASKGTTDITLIRKRDIVKLYGNFVDIWDTYQPRLVRSESLYRNRMRRSRHRHLSRMAEHDS
jgi:hypothetical protein